MLQEKGGEAAEALLEKASKIGAVTAEKAQDVGSVVADKVVSLALWSLSWASPSHLATLAHPCQQQWQASCVLCQAAHGDLAGSPG